MLNNIKQEQNKLEKLTQLISLNKTQKHIHKQQKTSKNDTPKLIEFKQYLNGDDNIKQQLELNDNDLINMPQDTINKILTILKNYINMDKSFRLKHETLKTLYILYLKIYKKNKDQNLLHKTSTNLIQQNPDNNILQQNPDNNILQQNPDNIQQQNPDNILQQNPDNILQQHNINNTSDTQCIDNNNNNNNTQPQSAEYIECIKKLNDKHKKLLFSSNIQHDPDNNTHTDILKNIHNEMKDNNSNMYRERIIILKKIKDEPEIDLQFKNKICGRLIAIFKSPPTLEHKPLQNLHKHDNNTASASIGVNELDNAYLRKHNELLTVFKAYQNLYSKVLNYKEQLDEYKKLSIKSGISRNSMDKMIHDQSVIMNTIDKMQDKLVNDNIINNSEKVLITPVVNNPENIKYFNDTMRDQIHNIIDRNNNINPHIKHKIETLISQYKT